MNDEIAQAFAHPERRSIATAEPVTRTGEMPDRISLRDHIVTVEIGAFQVERDITQRLSFNVVVEVMQVDTPLEDDVDNILSYDRVTEAIATELAAERLNLLETLADRIAARILDEPQAQRVFVRIEKLDRGPGALGVEIMRARSETRENTRVGTPSALVVFLPNIATQHADFAALIGQISNLKTPVILTVAAPETPSLQTGDTTTQRHIDLLAIEQNAWALTAQDPRINVVETRTELDWAIKHNQLSVWAPSKLVLSHVDLANTLIDPVKLTLWLADEIGASELITVGCEAPNADIPVRSIPVGGRI